MSRLVSRNFKASSRLGLEAMMSRLGLEAMMFRFVLVLVGSVLVPAPATTIVVNEFWS